MTISNPTADSREPRFFLVLNPVSGTGDAEYIEKVFADHMQQAGINWDEHRTTKDENVSDIVKEALQQGFTHIVAAGGDGTVAQTAHGLLNSNIPLGIIPTGTWNALARNLSIPLQPEEAIELLVGQNTIRPIDVMKIDNQVFLGTAGVGISSLTMKKTDRVQKQRFGFLAYFWSIFLQLSGVRLRKFNILIDDTQSISQRASEVLVINTGLTSKGLYLDKLNIQPDDGQVEICIVRARTLLDFIKLAFHMLLMKQSTDSLNFQDYKARHSITVMTGKHSLPVQGDGDVIGWTPFRLEVLPGAIQLIMPASELKKSRNES